MKLLIQTSRDDCAIVIDSANAGAAAALLAGAYCVKADGYGEAQRWSPTSEQCKIQFVTDDRIADFSEREKRLAKELDDANSQRWKEYRSAQESGKKVSELEAQIALLKSVTVCETKPAEEALTDQPATPPTPAS